MVQQYLWWSTINFKYKNINLFKLIYTNHFYLSFRYHQVEATLVEEMPIHLVGSYKWISIDEARIIRKQKWKDEIHFCPTLFLINNTSSRANTIGKM